MTAQGALFHVDAVQSVARLNLNVTTSQADFISLSAHKFYGPKGVGALYIRDQMIRNVEPQIHGGFQERGLRAGTLATHQIVGMGKAAALLRAQRSSEIERTHKLEKCLLDGLTRLPRTYLNGSTDKVAGIVNIRFADVNNESLIISLRNKVAISSGSACTSTQLEPSHVLLGLGLTEDEANCSVRISMGRFSSTDQINQAKEYIVEAVLDLRALNVIG